MNKKHIQIAVVLITLWVVVSPFLWWRNTFSSIGVQLPFSFIAHPIILAVAAVCASPFLMHGNFKVAIVLSVISIFVAGSLLFFPSAFTGGVVMNAGLLVILAVLTSRSTGPAQKAAQSG